MTAKFATNAGPDGLYCTADDTYALAGSGLDAELRLTTGKASRHHHRRRLPAGAHHGRVGGGRALQLRALAEQRRISREARLVGALTFLNVPFIPFTHDTILTFRFVADDATQCIRARDCPQPCTDDASAATATLQRRRVLPPRQLPGRRADLVRRRQRVQRLGGLRLRQRRRVRQVAGSSSAARTIRAGSAPAGRTSCASTRT